jgi:hypothetical protein
MVAALYKGKGSATDIKNYRDIMLGNDNGKAFGVHIRRAILPLAKCLSLETQYGSGMNGGETAVAHLYLRIIMHASKTAGLSSAVLFVDVSSAFATMLRRIVFQTDQGDESWLAGLKASGFSHQEISIIYEDICKLNALHDYEKSNDESSPSFSISGNTSTPHVSHAHRSQTMSIAFSMAKQMYTNTWVTVEGVSRAINAVEGSSAGMPMADIIYGIAMARVLSRIRTNVLQIPGNEDGLFTKVPMSGTMHDI